MTISDLDPVIHAPKRLGAMALLAGVEKAEFSFLRQHLDVSDSDLSKQMKTLQESGYVKINKTGYGRNSTTTFKITKAGREALASHLAALNNLINGTHLTEH